MSLKSLQHSSVARYVTVGSGKRAITFGAQSRYFGHVQNDQCKLKEKKTENSSLLRLKDTKEIIIQRKGTMVKDEKD